MQSYEDTTRSLIVKVWVEEVEEGSEQALWRGRVTHVATGEQHYFADLTTLMQVVVRSLREIGVTVDLPVLTAGVQESGP